LKQTVERSLPARDQSGTIIGDELLSTGQQLGTAVILDVVNHTFARVGGLNSVQKK
jgi:hypothetical protein